MQQGLPHMRHQNDSGAVAPLEFAVPIDKNAHERQVKEEQKRSSSWLQFIKIVGCFMFFSCGFALSNEGIIRYPGFKPLHRSFLTIVQMTTYCCCALIEHYWFGRQTKQTWSQAPKSPSGNYGLALVQLKAPFKYHAIVGTRKKREKNDES